MAMWTGCDVDKGELVPCYVISEANFERRRRFSKVDQNAGARVRPVNSAIHASIVRNVVLGLAIWFWAAWR